MLDGIHKAEADGFCLIAMDYVYLESQFIVR